MNLINLENVLEFTRNHTEMEIRREMSMKKGIICNISKCDVLRFVAIFKEERLKNYLCVSLEDNHMERDNVLVCPLEIKCKKLSLKQFNAKNYTDEELRDMFTPRADLAKIISVDRIYTQPNGLLENHGKLSELFTNEIFDDFCNILKERLKLEKERLLNQSVSKPNN